MKETIGLKNCQEEVIEALGSFSGPVPDEASIGLDVSTATVYVRGPNNQWVKYGQSPNTPGASAGVTSSTIGVNLDGGGTVLTTGQKGYVLVPFNATILSWSIVSRESGSATFDVWKKPTTKPTIADTITGSSKPTISGSDTANGSPTGWNTTINAGDIIGWNLDSVTTLTWCILQLTVLKS